MRAEQDLLLPAEPGAGLRGLNEQEIADFIERRGALEADLQRLETELADARGTTAATPTERVIDQEVGPPLSEVPDLGRDPNLTPPLAAQEGLGPLVRDALDQSPTAEARAAKYALALFPCCFVALSEIVFTVRWCIRFT